MGYIKDEYLIFTSWAKEPLQELRAEMKKIMINIFKDIDFFPDIANYVSPVLSGLANSNYFLFLPADGSKEGWEVSSAMNDVRESVIEWVIKYNYDSPTKIEIIGLEDDEYSGLSCEYVHRGY